MSGERRRDMRTKIVPRAACEHMVSRRALTSVVTVLTALHVGVPPRPAIADGEDASPSCSYSALEALPDVLGKMNNLATGDPKVALAAFQGDPLLGNPTLLTSAMDACAADDGARKTADSKYASLRDELKYQAGKTYDPRWVDPEDVADLQSAVKKLKAAMERYLASVPAAQRA